MSRVCVTNVAHLHEAKQVAAAQWNEVGVAIHLEFVITVNLVAHHPLQNSTQFELAPWLLHLKWN